MATLNPINIVARDLPDAWAQCVFKILEPGASRKRLVDKGSYEGEYRLEFDWIQGHVLYPGTRPLIPDIPIHLGIPNPVDNMNVVDEYFARYLMSDHLAGNEQYTYGERLTNARISPILHIDRDQTYMSLPIPYAVNQVDEVIQRYKEFGPGNNQLILQVGQPCDIMLKDPPCLRHIDTRIEENKLHFMVYFRSWCLWGGFPENLAGIQLLKEYMASEIGVEDGELIFTSKGLHLYGYAWQIAGQRRGLSEDDMNKLLKELKKDE